MGCRDADYNKHKHGCDKKYYKKQEHDKKQKYDKDHKKSKYYNKSKSPTQNKLININVVSLDEIAFFPESLQPQNNIAKNLAPNAGNSIPNGTQNGTNQNNYYNKSKGADQNKLINVNIINIDQILLAGLAANKNNAAKVATNGNKSERLNSLVNNIRSNFNCKKAEGDENKLININVISFDSIL